MPSATFGFLGNPESVQVGSGSYSIPSGKYGFVSASAFNGNVTINSTTWLRGGRFVTQSATASSTSVELTVSESGHYTVSTGASSSSLSGISVTHASGISGSGVSLTSINNYGTIFLHAGDKVAATYAASAALYLKIVGIVQGQSGPQNGQIWLKAGDTIDTTGDSTYAISIFPA
jgi:hypothetical protein